MKKYHFSFTGSITLFLCLTFTLIISLIMVTLESVRIQAMKARTEGLSHICLESVTGYFSLPLYDEYGLFAIPATDSYGDALVKDYMNQNFTSPELLFTSYDFFQIHSYTARPIKFYHITDKNGEIFIDQIIRYMKYAAPVSALDFLSSADYIDSGKKQSVDLSQLNTEEDEVDPSYDLSEFSGDTSEESELSEEDAANTKKSILQKIQELMNDTSLTIYLDPSTKVSSKSITLTSVPSAVCSYTSTANALGSYPDKFLYLLYLFHHFSSYTTVRKENTALSYEMEYIICGMPKDEDNLLNCILKIQTLRTGLNLAYLYTDSKKRSEAHALAAAATAMIPVPFIVEFTQLVLLSAWAYAEATADVRALLSGYKIPIFKSNSTWTLKLNDLLVFDRSSKSKASPTGLNYTQYLFLILYPEINSTTVYRTMDLIQCNIQKNEDKKFKMKQCITGFQYSFTFDFHPVFALPNSFYKKTSLFQHQFVQSYGY